MGHGGVSTLVNPANPNSFLSEVDFIGLGITSNPSLLENISYALDQIDALGNLHLHAARLYYGSIKVAAKNLDISVQFYRQLLQRPARWLREFKNLSEEDIEKIWLGATVILEMPDADRIAACKLHSISKTHFSSHLEQYRDDTEIQVVTPCIRLLDSYRRLWKLRRSPDILFKASGFTRPAKKVLESKSLVEKRASDSAACSVALHIISEYETYLWHRDQVNRHIKEQRRLGKLRHRILYESLVSRDGERCVLCNSEESLEIDHKLPVRLGGLTEMTNLQLLCFSCNSKKRDTFVPG